MTRQAHHLPILKTKLYRPAVVGDIVHRKGLVEKLENSRSLPLVLVAAPAGYGKSTLVSSWLEDSGHPSVWLSLDPADKDLRTFLTYFVTAIQSVEPRSCSTMSGRLRSKTLPDVQELAGMLNADLELLGDRMTLVLDDYHHIENRHIHEILTFQLRHVVPNLQLVILSRRDPPLPCASLQARGLMTEIRLNDLMFSLNETRCFIQSIHGDLNPSLLETLHNALEGWPVGLRLIAHALAQSGDPVQLIRGMPEGHPRIQSYLMEEVLADLSPEHRDCISRISLLERYCQPLNQALCNHSCKTSQERPCMFNTATPMQTAWNPLSIPLDAEGKWFRYHHQFRHLLRQRLHDTHPDSEINDIYQSAAAWSEQHGYIEEAIRYALKVSPQLAAGIVNRNRHEAMNKEQWTTLRHWLQQLPPALVEDTPDLLLLQAWCAIGYPEMFAMLDRVEELFAQQPDEFDQPALRGEVLAYRSLGTYVRADGKATARIAAEALALLEPTQLSERGFAHILYTLGLQMQGRFAEGRDSVLQALGDRSIQQTTYHTRLLAALCFAYWIDCNPPQLHEFSKEYQRLGSVLGFAETQDHAANFMGLQAYAVNEAETAASYFRQVVENPEISNLHNHLHCIYALAMIHQSAGRQAEANQLAQRAVSLSLQERSPEALNQSQAFTAELALRQGRTTEAGQWAETFDEKSNLPVMYRFYVPHFTLVRTWIALGREDTLSKAAQLSRELQASAENIHNRHYTIMALILHALALDAAGHRDEALNPLSHAVEQAYSGGNIRLFVDEGPQLIPLLSQLELNGEALRFTGRILSAYPQRESAPGTASTEGRMPVPGLIDPLSPREREVLELMAEHLENKAIAERLYIAPGTVKRHTNSIYSKLAVHSRRSAVEKAYGLGLLKD